MTVVADCFLCKRPIVDKPHEHHWRHIPQWGITICHTCNQSNWGGIVPNKHSDLVKHLEAKDIEVEYNAKGWIDIPG